MLWIHFFVNAPFGIALGFDRATPGLMEARPRPRGETVLTPRLMATVALTGTVITVGLLLLISLGTSHLGGLETARSVAFTSFALCLIVGALECRSETQTVLTTETFDSKQLNWTLLAEFVLAVLVTQMDVFNRLLDTTPITLGQFGWALVPALVLFVVWELGKLGDPGGRATAARDTRRRACPTDAARAVRSPVPGPVARRPRPGGGDADRLSAGVEAVGRASGRSAGVVARQCARFAIAGPKSCAIDVHAPATSGSAACPRRRPQG